MLTWKLWRAINRPPLRSPLYRRAFTRQGPPSHAVSIRIPFLGFFKDVSLIVLPVTLILLGAPILVLLYYLALIVSPLLLPLANTVYGLMHANSASGSIAREREQQTYDVICTAPQGILGVHWSYCTGWIHYHWLYRYALLGVLSIGIVASVFGLSPQAVFGPGHPSLVITLIRAATLGSIFVIDYVQTIILSSLTTLLIPTYADNTSDARIWASSLFLALQLAVYLPTLLIGVYALPNTFSLMQIDPALSAVLIPLLVIAFFAVLRETIIVGLWHAVQQQLSTTTVELDAITRLAL